MKDIMVSSVVTVHEGDAFHIVWEKFETHKIRHLPVVNDAGCVVGLISQRHLYKIHSPRHWKMVPGIMKKTCWTRSF